MNFLYRCLKISNVIPAKPSRQLMPKTNKNFTTEKTPKFKLIYDLPIIRPLATFSRLKLYQSYLTLVVLPCAAGLYYGNIIDGEMAIAATCVGIAGCIPFYSLGILPYKLVGKIYIDEKVNFFKISYLDFWGNRVDDIIPVKDLVPLSDLPKTPADAFYYTLRRYSTKDTYKLNLRFGRIVEDKLFHKYF